MTAGYQSWADRERDRHLAYFDDVQETESQPAPTDPSIIASEQVAQAMADLARAPETFVRWPFPELDTLTGPLAPGNVWFICAASGGGKTTFVSSVIERWRLAGKRIYVMPLETRPSDFRIYLACMATGDHPGDVLSGHLASIPEGPAIRRRIKEQFRLQETAPFVDQVMVASQRAINLEGLERGMDEAANFGAHVVVVDHIDHLEGGDGSHLYAEAKRVNDGALRLAQDRQMILVFTSQLNMSSSKGDYLAKYLPPKDEHVAFGSLKRNNSTGMIGLFRPFRARRPDESEKEYKASLAIARAGVGNVIDALEPNTMGVVAMKLRNYGAREGGKVLLAVHHGRVEPLPERDRYTTARGPQQAL